MKGLAKALAPRNGEVSQWMVHAGANQRTRPPLDGDETADVCVIGAGLTGLWAAYRILTQRPDAKVVVLEAEHVGYGASGRNDGWLCTTMSANPERLAAFAGPDAVVGFQRLMIESTSRILDILELEGIDADAQRSGHLSVARTQAALGRLKEEREHMVRWGYSPERVRLLDADQTRQRIAVRGAVGGLFDPDTAKVNPALMVLGLAKAVERLGARIFEGSRAIAIRPGRVAVATADHAHARRAATVASRQVLVCTEAYSGGIGGMPARRIVPVNSSIVMTARLDQDQWRRIGWDGAECFSDAAHVFTYAQRTPDGRIAIGGRGKAYRFASGTPGLGAVDRGTITALERRLREYFPALPERLIEHAWCGSIGVTRDWCAFVHYSPATGLGWAGGYAGHGVTSAFVAAHTLADRLCGLDSVYARAPWLGYRPPNWEPEPIRWLGIRGMYKLFAVADRHEETARAAKTSTLARVGSRLAGLG
jgi:glycine/D-amino acid oxidase-like deaminating enzyme